MTRLRDLRGGGLAAVGKRSPPSQAWTKKKGGAAGGRMGGGRQRTAPVSGLDKEEWRRRGAARRRPPRTGQASPPDHLDLDLIGGHGALRIAPMIVARRQRRRVVVAVPIPRDRGDALGQRRRHPMPHRR